MQSYPFPISKLLIPVAEGKCRMSRPPSGSRGLNDNCRRYWGTGLKRRTSLIIYTIEMRTPTWLRAQQSSSWVSWSNIQAAENAPFHCTFRLSHYLWNMNVSNHGLHYYFLSLKSKLYMNLSMTFLVVIYQMLRYEPTLTWIFHCWWDSSIGRREYRVGRTGRSNAGICTHPQLAEHIQIDHFVLTFHEATSLLVFN